ncbi:MAG: hypothetical protein H6822_28140 [Planctomycetaceae bacterium]|nr:hypothetical protein [Planctomycetales bacterium]MCB9926052.1 hypothetical protein [Planctomycetaceae bacterium]
MKAAYVQIRIVLLATALIGCSSSTPVDVSDASGIESFAATTITPGPAVLPETTAEIQASPASGPSPNGKSAAPQVAPFRNPFAPPKDPPPEPIEEEPQPKEEPEVEPEPESTPEPVQSERPLRTPPSVRLLGFTNVGEPKVLISQGDELRALAIGETFAELKILKIDAPDVTMEFDEREIKLSLFDQAWQHEGSSSSTAVNARSSRPTPARPSATPGTRISQGSTPASGPNPAAPGIPGFGPNDGQAPGFHPPGTPGAAINSGGAGVDLPGMPGVSPGSAGPVGGGIPGGGLPGGGLPSIDLPDGGGGLPSLGVGSLPNGPSVD